MKHLIAFKKQTFKNASGRQKRQLNGVYTLQSFEQHE